jgi:hypothetical protein
MAAGQVIQSIEVCWSEPDGQCFQRGISWRDLKRHGITPWFTAGFRARLQAVIHELGSRSWICPAPVQSRCPTSNQTASRQPQTPVLTGDLPVLSKAAQLREMQVRKC